MTTSPERVAIARRFMRGHWTRWLALGFGSGLAPKAPGTFGTLAAWVLFEVGRWALGLTSMALITLAGLIAGGWLCGRAAADLGVADHPAIVWDEFVGFWLVLLFCYGWLAGGWVLALTGFGLFRLFDAAKPPPIGWLDKHVKGGIGIMIDDIAAAIAAMIGLVLITALLPSLLH